MSEYDPDALTERALRATQAWERAPGPPAAYAVAAAFANAYRFAAGWEALGRREIDLARNRAAWEGLLADGARHGALLPLAPPMAEPAVPERLAAFTADILVLRPRRSPPSAEARRAAREIARERDEAEVAFQWLRRHTSSDPSEHGEAEAAMVRFADRLTDFDLDARRNPHWFLPAADWLGARAAALVATPDPQAFWWLSPAFLSALDAAAHGTALRLADAIVEVLGVGPQDLLFDAEGDAIAPPGACPPELAAVTEDGEFRLWAQPSHPEVLNGTWRLRLWRETAGISHAVEEGWQVRCGGQRVPVEGGEAELPGPLTLDAAVEFIPPGAGRPNPASWIRLLTSPASARGLESPTLSERQR